MQISWVAVFTKCTHYCGLPQAQTKCPTVFKFSIWVDLFTVFLSKKSKIRLDFSFVIRSCSKLAIFFEKFDCCASRNYTPLQDDRETKSNHAVQSAITREPGKIFSDASSHLYKRVRPSVRWSVGPSVQPCIGPSQYGLKVCRIIACDLVSTSPLSCSQTSPWAKRRAVECSGAECSRAAQSAAEWSDVEQVRQVSEWPFPPMRHLWTLFTYSAVEQWADGGMDQWTHTLL